jgi:hypothetical protein
LQEISIPPETGQASLGLRTLIAFPEVGLASWDPFVFPHPVLATCCGLDWILANMSVDEQVPLEVPTPFDMLMKTEEMKTDNCFVKDTTALYTLAK